MVHRYLYIGLRGVCVEDPNLLVANISKNSRDNRDTTFFKSRRPKEDLFEPYNHETDLDYFCNPVFSVSVS